MSLKVYDENISKLELYADILEAENDIKEGRVQAGTEHLKALKSMFEV